MSIPCASSMPWVQHSQRVGRGCQCELQPLWRCLPGCSLSLAPVLAVRGATPQCPENLKQGRPNEEGSGHHLHFTLPGVWRLRMGRILYQPFGHCTPICSYSDGNIQHHRDNPRNYFTNCYRSAFPITAYSSPEFEDLKWGHVKWKKII